MQPEHSGLLAIFWCPVHGLELTTVDRSMWLKGTLDYNLSLSNSRAKAMVSRLSSQSGISIDRLVPPGLGQLVNWPRWRPTYRKEPGHGVGL